MTKYDLWLNAHGGGFFGPGYYEPSYEFSRPTHEQFKNDVRELIACYPDGKPDDFDEQSLDTVWQTVNELRITSEHLEQTDVPAEIVDGTTQPLFELGHLRIFSDGYAQYMAYTIGADVEGGFRLLWRRDRFHLNRDYRVDKEGQILAVKLPMLAACAGALNPKLSAAIAALTKAPDSEADSRQRQADCVERPQNVDQPVLVPVQNRVKAKRVDLLQAEVLQILGENPDISPGEVMGMLIRRAGKLGSCVVDHTSDSVSFKNKSGNFRSVDIEALTERIARARAR